MSQSNASNIGEATVRITADTQPLKEGIAEAKAETEKLGDSAEAVGAKTSAGFSSAAVGIGAYALAVIAGLTAAVEAAYALDDAINGKSDFDFNAPTGFAAQIKKIREEAEKLREEASTTGLKPLIADAGELYTGNFLNRRQTAINEANEKENQAARLDGAKKLREKEQRQKEEAESRAASIESQIERERIAELDGAERIEAQRQAAIKSARKRFGTDGDELVDQINARYDAELRRLEELEARRKQAEDERAAREKQHAEERERREREALERLARQQQEIADKTAAAIASAFSKARTDFASALSMKDLVIGVQALNANLDNMRRNRQQIAAGDIYSG